MRKIHWNNLAKLDYYENIDYLLNKWSEKDAQEFIDVVFESEIILSKGNVDFRETDIADLRCYVVCKQITLFYRIVDKCNIEFLRFWNNSKDKRKLKL
ncbi:MAG: hypothetical protein JEZ09_13270 [Salinivirgaceae bacterium]|nr:hypothetical protein [Salinivirgaceae bacterium]